MLSFSQTTGYAIAALACLARHGSESMMVREIAVCTDMPLPYLSKVLHRLCAAGMVESKRGYKGGVKLAGRPEHISLLQIHRAVESARQSVVTEGTAENPRPNTFWEAFHDTCRVQLATMILADVLAYENSPHT
ncbi:MAG: Rrf2 family transcriptional regulator [Verrucomicrobia bacterium]|nr:MAG: Rrf2 family transcriptional regulator [Verrucomicrobiota bacterium]